MPESGKKFDQLKAPLDLLSTEALNQIAMVMGHGAKKYGRFNYRKGLEWSRVISACMRHLTAFNAGENLDPETQLSHVAHAGANIIMLLEYIKSCQQFDDRYDKDGKAKGEIRNGVSSEPSKSSGISEQQTQETIGSSSQTIMENGRVYWEGTLYSPPSGKFTSPLIKY